MRVKFLICLALVIFAGFLLSDPTTDVSSSTGKCRCPSTGAHPDVSTQPEATKASAETALGKLRKLARYANRSPSSGTVAPRPESSPKFQLIPTSLPAPKQHWVHYAKWHAMPTVDGQLSDYLRTYRSKYKSRPYTPTMPQIRNIFHATAARPSPDEPSQEHSRSCTQRFQKARADTEELLKRVVHHLGSASSAPLVLTIHLSDNPDVSFELATAASSQFGPTIAAGEWLARPGSLESSRQENPDLNAFLRCVDALDLRSRVFLLQWSPVAVARAVAALEWQVDVIFLEGFGDSHQHTAALAWMALYRQLLRPGGVLAGSGYQSHAASVAAVAAQCGETAEKSGDFWLIPVAVEEVTLSVPMAWRAPTDHMELKPYPTLREVKQGLFGDPEADLLGDAPLLPRSIENRYISSAQQAKSHIHQFIMRQLRRPPKLIIEVGSFIGSGAVHVWAPLVTNNVQRQYPRPTPRRPPAISRPSSNTTRQNGIVICVDTWLGDVNMRLLPQFSSTLKFRDGRPNVFETFLSRVATHQLGNHIVPLRLGSLQAARVLAEMQWPIDVLYLDSAHEIDETFAEMDLYYPLVRPGGLLAGDDYQSFPAVRADVTAFAAVNNLTVRTIGATKEHWYIIKPI